MASISGRYDPSSGPLLRVAVAPAGTGSAADLAATTPLGAAFRSYSALIDTGASSTCVSDKVVAELGLRPIGKARVRGAHGARAVNSYLFALGISSQISGTASAPPPGRPAIFDDTEGMSFVNTGLAFDVLVGRDILGRGVFIMTWDGRFILSL